jgi:hypothetical protein
MSKKRIELVILAYKKFDKDGSGIDWLKKLIFEFLYYFSLKGSLTIEDLKSYFDFLNIF